MAINEISLEQGQDAMHEVLTREGNLNQHRVDELVRNATNQVTQGMVSPQSVFGGYLLEQQRIMEVDQACNQSVGSFDSNDMPPPPPRMTRGNRF